jgi:predicted NBD/HSP70 family sugar kinase
VSIAPQRPSNAAVLRELSLTAVLDALREHPRGSRAELATQTGLSKPTVGAALGALGKGGLVRERGRSTGRRGPGASLYEFVPDAATALAVDAGSRRVRAVVTDLEGATLRDLEVRLRRPTASKLLDAIGKIAAELRGAETELAVVGSPGIVDPTSGRIRSSPQIDGWEGIEAEKALTDVIGVRTTVENDVNLAAAGELARGSGRGRSSFAYLNVGSGLGAGLVFDGRLFRGRHGAAGEVGFLAIGAATDDGDGVRRGAMETRLSGGALVEFAQRRDRDAPDDLKELFDRARSGDRLGRAVVEEAVAAIAACVASINAVVDLELVLLGGGIGGQTELLLEPVREAVARLVPYPPELMAGELGDRATLAGATAIGVEEARRALIRRCL